MRRKPDGRRGVALGRLRQNLALGNLRELLYDLRAQLLAGENPEAFGRKHRTQSIHRLLNQGAVPEEFEDLLGAAATAARPESSAAAARENQTVIVRHATRSEFRAPALVCGSIAFW